MNFEKLLRYIAKPNGVFFEAGANDGKFQSYTYRLEKEFGWTGVLVEPSARAFAACQANRQQSQVLNCALTDEDVEFITGDFDGNPMASVNGVRLQRSAAVAVRAMSLTQVFNAHLKDQVVDLMSIDVENYELNVLRSLDYTVYRPRFILVEIYKGSFYDVVLLLVSKGYGLISNITDFNLGNNSHWDGTHNDYLFQDLAGQLPPEA